MVETVVETLNKSEWEKRYHLAHQELLDTQALLEHQKRITETISRVHVGEMASAIALNTQLRIRLQALEGVGPNETTN